MKTGRMLLLSALLVAGVSVNSMQAAHAEKVLQGEVCSANVHKLTSDIEWYKSLSKAEDAAREQGKLVFWVHMLGKIDGAT